MRPNYAQDAPPTEIKVGGFAYPVNVDFRVWLDVMRLMRDWIPDAQTPQHRQHNAEIYGQLQTLAFGGVLSDEEPQAVMEAIGGFLAGYPSAPVGHDDNGQRTFSFEYDLNEIIIAIRNQSGIDLSYRRKEPFHWWEFLLEFRTLCGDHYILNLMDARGYTGKDRDMLRRKRLCALPPEHSAAEKAVLDDIRSEFYNA